MLNLTNHEMFIAKIGLISGLVATGIIDRIKATEILFKHGKKHGYSDDYSLKLEATIDQMLGDDTLT